MMILCSGGLVPYDSNVLIYKEDLLVNSEFLTDGEAMKDVIEKGLNLI